MNQNRGGPSGSRFPANGGHTGSRNMVAETSRSRAQPRASVMRPGMACGSPAM